jgi:hypothetical protein
MRIDQVNILLIVLASSLACLFPIEVFLLSYAILGPLHYITELTWLDEKKYYTNSDDSIWIFAGIAVLLSIVTILVEFSADAFHFLNYTILFPALMLIALTYSMIQDVASKKKTTLIIASSLLLFILLTQLKLSYLLLAVLLPTIIHVYFFTGNFLLLGALKSKSNIGIISFVVFLLATCSLFFIPISWSYTHDNASEVLGTINFRYLIETLSGEAFQSNIFHHGNTIFVIRFLAFAYSYHYLNWFSKTNVIGWLKVPKRKLILAFVTWLIAVVTYFIDYRTGFFVLFFLSILHVIAEFPLNYITFKNTIVALRNFKVKES